MIKLSWEIDYINSELRTWGGEVIEIKYEVHEAGTTYVTIYGKDYIQNSVDPCVVDKELFDKIRTDFFGGKSFILVSENIFLTGIITGGVIYDKEFTLHGILICGLDFGGSITPVFAVADSYPPE